MPAAPAALSSAGQFKGADSPVPRWSNMTRSRVLSAGASALAANSPAAMLTGRGHRPRRLPLHDWGSRRSPPPPRLPANAPGSTERVPGARPLRSSGDRHGGAEAKPELSAQGVKLSAEEADERRASVANNSVGERAPGRQVVTRLRIETRNSGTRAGGGAQE